MSNIKNARKNMYLKNPYCPECGVFMILPEDVPGSTQKQLQPDNMCTYEHIFDRNDPDRKANKRNRILCKKCNNSSGGEIAAAIEKRIKDAAMMLQCVDCNCNDCLFMKRDVDRLKQSLRLHNQWQLNYFNVIKNNLLKKASDWISRGFPDKTKVLMSQVDKMKFQFDRKVVAIHYGYCDKFKKPVSFIPNICQLDTQECFLHRRS